MAVSIGGQIPFPTSLSQAKRDEIERIRRQYPIALAGAPVASPALPVETLTDKLATRTPMPQPVISQPAQTSPVTVAPAVLPSMVTPKPALTLPPVTPPVTPSPTLAPNPVVGQTTPSVAPASISPEQETFNNLPLEVKLALRRIIESQGGALVKRRL